MHGFNLQNSVLVVIAFDMVKKTIISRFATNSNLLFCKIQECRISMSSPLSKVCTFETRETVGWLCERIVRAVKWWTLLSHFSAIAINSSAFSRPFTHASLLSMWELSKGLPLGIVEKSSVWSDGGSVGLAWLDCESPDGPFPECRNKIVMFADICCFHLWDSNLRRNLHEAFFTIKFGKKTGSIFETHMWGGRWGMHL